MNRIVIVGGGLAGSGTVKALRKLEYSGEITVLAAEPHPPYDRPPLSKRMLLDPEPYDPMLPFDVERLGVDLRLETRAVELRTGVVVTESGEIPYDGLVIATGAEPIRLPGDGDGVHYLRTRDNANALRTLLRPDAAVVIVGAGWIGAEVATAAAKAGCKVTVIERAATPVAHALPADIAGWMVPWYAEAGVDLRCGSNVERVAADGVLLTDGERISADVVLVAVGVRPATGWLEGSPVALDSGVAVDAGLRTNLPDVLAVGDVVARWSPRYGIRIRGEHWDDAARSPAVVAANLLGDDQTYDPVPYVWSEQFGRMVQYGGRPGIGVRRIDRDGSVFWLDADDRIIGLFTVDRPRDFVQGRKLATARSPIDPTRLADPATPVKETVASF